MEQHNSHETLADIVSLCRRRGFIYPSSEIYGGLSSAWDYGPLGVELKRQLQNRWWQEMTQQHRNIVGLDSSILMHQRVWEASGHVENFSDLMTEDTITRVRYRWDQLSEECRNTMQSPDGNPLSEPRAFNLMFTTHIGPVVSDAARIYLRPETAQGIYVNFRNVLQTTRVKIPFGIAQIGKAFRNEIVTKRFIFRTCEFEQMEMQYFVAPTEAPKWFKYWKEKRVHFYHQLGIRPTALRFHPHGSDELAHYAKEAVDIQYHFPFGWQELEGIHNRGDWDLSRHMEFSKKDLNYLDETGNRYLPYIIETSAGLTRSVLMLLCEGFRIQQLENESRTLLSLHPNVAPVTVAVFPLLKKDGLPERAEKIEHELRHRYRTFYDLSGAIGRRYRRQDEIGTPFCVTVDHQSLKDETVTLRERDSMQQQRIKINALPTHIEDAITSWHPPEREK